MRHFKTVSNISLRLVIFFLSKQECYFSCWFHKSTAKVFFSLKGFGIAIILSPYFGFCSIWVSFQYDMAIKLSILF